MLKMSDKSNLLEQSTYRYSLQDVKDPELYREMYSYEEVPKVAFNFRRVPMNTPSEIWITDTSFRDGMQSMAPYEPDQIVDLFKLLSRLGGWGTQWHYKAVRIFCLYKEGPGSY